MSQPTPVCYTIHLQPDLINFRFEGRCELELTAVGPVAEVKLNILQIAVWRCRVPGGGFLVDPTPGGVVWRFE